MYFFSCIRIIFFVYLNAGINSLIVGWGFSKKEDLLKEKGIKLVENPNEILKYIQGEGKC